MSVPQLDHKAQALARPIGLEQHDYDLADRLVFSDQVNHVLGENGDELLNQTLVGGDANSTGRRGGCHFALLSVKCC